MSYWMRFALIHMLMLVWCVLFFGLLGVRWINAFIGVSLGAIFNIWGRAGDERST